jgi:hypothetical protein
MTTEITIYPQPHNLSPYQQRQATAFDSINDNFFGNGGLNFKSVLDTVNPLQQLPGVSTVYRAMSNDTISSGSRLIGGALLGGPIGFGMALLNEIVSGTTGKDIGTHLLAAITDKYDSADSLVPQQQA